MPDGSLAQVTEADALNFRVSINLLAPEMLLICGKPILRVFHSSVILVKEKI
jgi:hypothetical protein